MAVDLSTSYLGLRLPHPFLTGASPLADTLDAARRLEDAGCAAIVLHSLFEEQISQAGTGRIHHMDPLSPEFAEALSHYPKAGSYAWEPDEYLEHLRRTKSAVQIPVIASLNGTTPEQWLKFARLIEQAGADALEVNLYEVVADTDRSAVTVERNMRLIVQDLKHVLTIPFAVKLSPFFTAFAHVAADLERAGANGLVLFNRFMQPDIDLRHVSVWPRIELSHSSELLLRLRWLAILRGQLRCSLAATGGVATAEDGIKAILAGADAVQLVSAILRHGPSYFATMRDGLRSWMEAHEVAHIDDLRGRLSLANAEASGDFERGQYLCTLSGWSSWLAYQSALRAHRDDKPAS